MMEDVFQMITFAHYNTQQVKSYICSLDSVSSLSTEKGHSCLLSLVLLKTAFCSGPSNDLTRLRAKAFLVFCMNICSS